MEQPGTLTDVVRLAYTRTGASSSRRLEAYARRHGHTLTHTTINQISAGTYASRPGEKTLRALAFLSGVPYNDVRVVAGLPPKVGRSLADQLPPDVDELEARPRAVLVDMARVLLDLQRRDVPGAGEERGVSVATLSDLGIVGATGRNGTDRVDRTGDTDP